MARMCCVQASKRNVYIRDDSGKSVEVTLWGAYASNPGDQLEEVRLCQLGFASVVAGPVGHAMCLDLKPACSA